MSGGEEEKQNPLRLSTQELGQVVRWEDPVVFEELVAERGTGDIIHADPDLFQWRPWGIWGALDWLLERGDSAGWLEAQAARLNMQLSMLMQRLRPVDALEVVADAG